MWCVPCWRRGGAASLMCWGWSVLHQGLRGVLSVTEGFNFPPSDRHLHLHSSAGPTEVQQSPLNHRSPFAQYIWITGNKITTPALLQSYFFFFSLIASAPAFTTLSFMASSGGGWYLRLLQSFFLLIRQEEALVGLQVKPQCHPVATAGNCSQHNYWNYSWGL